MKQTKKIKMRKVEKTKIEYYICCPICDKEIKGSSPNQADWNLDIHIVSCKRKEAKK